MLNLKLKPGLLTKMRTVITGVMCIALVAISPATVHAHQPFFEDQDATAKNPWRINDPSISLALYGTLQSADDIDYFTMKVKRGQRIPVQVTIPQIKGQAAGFAPTLVVIGPGLGLITFTIDGSTVITQGLLLPPPVKAGTFYEPFSRDNYWTWQDVVITTPQAGDYRIMVWHAKGCVGRYTLAIGSSEIRGGDPDFRAKKLAFWKPVPTKASRFCDL